MFLGCYFAQIKQTYLSSQQLFLFFICFTIHTCCFPSDFKALNYAD